MDRRFGNKHGDMDTGFRDYYGNMGRSLIKVDKCTYRPKFRMWMRTEFMALWRRFVRYRNIDKRPASRKITMQDIMKELDMVEVHEREGELILRG